MAGPVGVRGEARAHGAQTALRQPVERGRHESVERGQSGMSVADGCQLAPGVAERLVRRAVGLAERGPDETKQAAQLLGPFPTVVHRGLEVAVLDLLERRDRPFDLLVGDAANGVGHRLVAVEGISHTGPLPAATPGNPGR